MLWPIGCRGASEGRTLDRTYIVYCLCGVIYINDFCAVLIATFS